MILLTFTVLAIVWVACLIILVRDEIYGPKPSDPIPDLFAGQCAKCLAIRCVDKTWVPRGMVKLPKHCTLSHGLCPVCEKAAYAELDSMTKEIETLAKSKPYEPDHRLLPRRKMARR